MMEHSRLIAESPPELAKSELLDERVLRHHLKSCGRAVKVYKGSRLFPPGLVAIGDFSQIDESVRIYAGQGVQIGRHVHLAIGCSISGGGACEIGDFAGIGAGTRIITGTELLEGGLSNPTVPREFRAVQRSFVRVQRHALIFTSCVILPGVTVGEGAVASAGSIIHHDLKPWCIYAGNPLVQVGVRTRETILASEKALLALEEDSFQGELRQLKA